jgi:putative nucleotidyltransferase with HDIG domain
MQKADDYIDRVHHLFPAPRVVPQLLSVLNKRDLDNSEIVSLISHDPSLTANVLRLSNSAYFRGAAEICSLEEAVTRLGSKEVYRLVVAISGAMALSPPKQASGIEADEFLNHSITSAVAAQILAKDAGEDESLAFTAALLHDIGKLVLASSCKNFYVWLERVEEDATSLLDAEKRLLGVDHARVGGRVLERWKFPKLLSVAVGFHHDPAKAPDHQRLAASISAGNSIAYLLGHSYGHRPSLAKCSEDALRILGLKEADLQDCKARTNAELKKVRVLFPERAAAVAA